MAAQVPQLPTCSTHPDEVVALFCVSCDKGICMTCMIGNSHGQHQLCKPDQNVEVKKKEFKELMQKEGEDKMCEKFGQQVKLVIEHKATVTDHRSQTSTEIINRAKELVQLIEKEKDDLLVHSKRLHDQELNLLSDQESVALRCLSYIEKHRSDPESFLDKQDMLEVMRDLKLVQTYTAPTDIKAVVTFDVIHQVTKGEVKQMFGTIKEEQKAESAKKTEHTYTHMELVNVFKLMFPSEESLSSMCFKPISKISPIDMKEAFVLINDGKLFQVQFNVHSKLTPKLVAEGVQDITQVGKDGIYLCTEREVKVCTLKGDIYVLDGSQDTVRSVTLTKTGNILVCSKKMMKVEESSQLEAQIHSKLYTLSPAGIQQGLTLTVPRDAGNMYRIEQHCGETCYLGTSSKGGAIQQDSEYWSNFEYVYDIEDKYKGKIGSSPDQLFDPRGICCDDRDQIIIADYGNNALHLLNENFKFETFLLREWDGLSKPTAITLYNGFLWIGQEDGNIQIRKYEP